MESILLRQKSTQLGLLFCFGLLMLFSDTVQTELALSIQRCLTVTIPSLYAMMILSQLFLLTNSWQWFGAVFSPLAKKFFPKLDTYLALILFSQIAGYPVGATMLCNLVKKGTFRKEEAALLLPICYNCGPAFLLGLLFRYPNAKALCGLIFSSTVLSNLLLGIWQLRKCKALSSEQKTAETMTFSPSFFLSGIADAGKHLLQLCGVILCFSIGCSVLEQLHFFAALETLAHRVGLSFSVTAICKSLLEITFAETVSLPVNLYLPILAALLSFGGICVILQIRATIGDTFSMTGFFRFRCIAAALSALFCFLGESLLPTLPKQAIMTMASVIPAKHHGTAPVLLLILMTILVFLEEHRLRGMSS